MISISEPRTFVKRFLENFHERRDFFGVFDYGAGRGAERL